MFAVMTSARKALRPIAALATAFLLAACDPTMLTNLGGTGSTSDGPTIDTSKPVQVALLIPKTDNAGAGPIAVALENAARMAIADLDGVQIDLRVYDTGGVPASAAAQAQQAVNDGAKIILGPLRADAVNAAGLAVADEGINVLGFSNNPSIAGGNVFVLGSTFNNVGNRLMSYARSKGKKSVVIVHAADTEGQIARVSVEQAAAKVGVSVASSEAYALSVEGVNATVKRVASIITSGAADTVFLTPNANNAAMPMFLRLLPENGVKPEQIQYVGLSRWDVRPDLFSLPGANGAWFAIPDEARQKNFNGRYQQAYGSAPNPVAGLAYDGISAIGLLAKAGRSDALSGRALTSSSFTGSGGIFRLLSDGTSQRALAVATVRNNQMVILDPAPSSLSGAGF